jgi:hypothetical protein
MSYEVENSSNQPEPGTSSTDYTEMYRDAQPPVESSPLSDVSRLSHRFELDSLNAPEGTARERLHALRDAITTVQEQYPEVLGATVFGSTVKGRVKLESDIDGFLFVDAGRAAEVDRPLHTEEQRYGTYLQPSTSPYKAAIVEDMRDQGFTDPGLFKDFGELAISPAIISDSIEKLIPKAEAVGAFRERVLSMEPTLKDAQIQAINDLNDLNSANKSAGMSEVEQLAAEKAFVEALPHSVDRELLHYSGLAIPRNIRGLFHLGINNQQLRTYRSMALNGLAANGQAGEVIWTELTKQVLHFEEGRRGASIYFPRTLAEASAIYGS